MKTCDWGNKKQLWIPLDTTSGLLRSRTYPGRCLSAGWQTWQLLPCSSYDASRFQYLFLGGDPFVMWNTPDPTQCLTMSNTANNTVTFATCDRNNEQQQLAWRWTDRSKMKGLITKLGTNWCIDFGGSSSSDKLSLTMEACNATFATQLWYAIGKTGPWQSVAKLLYCVERNESDLTLALCKPRVQDQSFSTTSLTGNTLEDLANQCLSNPSQPPMGLTCNDGQLTSISLGVSDNVFGDLPCYIFSENLKTLEVSSRWLAGSIPEALRNAVALEHLNLSGAGLAGAIPSWIGDLSTLTAMDLSDNKLSGSIPSTLGQLGGLQILRLNNNLLSGTVPESLSSIISLHTLDLHSNILVGTLPSQLATIPALTFLDVHNNDLTGFVDGVYSNLSSYSRDTGFTSNYFTGSMTNLSLDQNCLQNTLGNQTIGAFTSNSYCTFFCNITASSEACGGMGVCSASANDQMYTCSCTDPYVTSPVNLGSCISKDELDRLKELDKRFFIKSKFKNSPSLCVDPSNPKGVTMSSCTTSWEGWGVEQTDPLIQFTWVWSDGSKGQIKLFGKDVCLDYGGFSTQERYAITMQLCKSTSPQLWLPLDANFGFLRPYDMPDFCLTDRGSDSYFSSFLSLDRCDQQSIDQQFLPQYLTPVHKDDERILLEEVASAWKFNGGGTWIKGDPCSLWQGVTCDPQSSRVIDLSLAISNIAGPIPPAIGNLEFLTGMDLSGNQINSSLPSTLSSLTQLAKLWLSNNEISGSLPAFLGSLLALQTLRLDGNQLYGSIPSSFSDLTKAAEITLTNNFLSSSTCNVTLERTGLNISLAFNCIPCCSTGGGNPCNNKTALACYQFCDVTATDGPCNGLGDCTFFGPNKIVTCVCVEGYTPDPQNSGTCIPKSEASFSPPPPPPSTGPALLGFEYADDEVPGTTTGGGFQVPPFLKLNRWSRYLTYGAKISNTILSWDISWTTSWMAPADMFFRVQNVAPPSRGVIRWDFTRNQICASCWAESAADAISSATLIAQDRNGGAVKPLSSTQLTRCTEVGCLGSFPQSALEYAARFELAANANFEEQSLCPAEVKSPPAQAVMYELVKWQGWMGLLLTLQVQPAIIAIAGSSVEFQAPLCSDRHFVLNSDTCYTGSIDHTVLVVGYDLNAISPFWVIRNSWGSSWCNNGFLRLGIQAGDGVCGMNLYPALYPISAPLPDDPCYKKSITPDGSRDPNAPVVKPCGGGVCEPEPKWGPYSYKCKCSWFGMEEGRLVAVNNTVNITLPGANLGITQTCVPVDACGLSDYNPCFSGTCVNDMKGGYSCICPLGFTQAFSLGKLPYCTFVGANEVATNYTVEAEATRKLVAATYNLTVDQLNRLNIANGDYFKVGQNVTVANQFYNCSIGYMVTSTQSKWEDIVRDVFTYKNIATGLSVTTSTAEALASLNYGANSSLPLQRGQIICLRWGFWISPPPCTVLSDFAPTQTCSDVAQLMFQNGADPMIFYSLNAGISCEIAPSVQGKRKVCIGTGTFGNTIKCPPPNDDKNKPSKFPKHKQPYVWKKDDTCEQLISQGYFTTKATESPAEVNRGTRFQCINLVTRKPPTKGTQICTLPPPSPPPPRRPR